MKTRTLYYPNRKKPELEVEVTRDGDIVSAFSLIPAFDVWVDAMEYLRNRPQKMEEIRQDSACICWDEESDFKYESYKDFLSENRKQA